MNNKDISVILLLYKTPKKLLKNLEKYKNFKILILDQSNDEELKKWVKNKFKKVQFFGSLYKNVGFAKGINFLVKKVKTKFFLCTQPDVLISDNSIKILKMTLVSNNNCIISVPNINPSKRKKGKRIVDNFYGGIFMADKSKFLKMKMFDENFFFYWEDMDLSSRIKKTRYKIITNFDASAKHFYGSSSSFSVSSLFIRSSNFKFGEYLFQNKNNKLRIIKIFRQTLMLLPISAFYLLTLRPIKSLEKFFNFIGILKFILFKIRN